jgi:hypothetical protein
MANARTSSEQAEVVYVDMPGPGIAGVVSWSGGRVLLKSGQRYRATDPLVLARPELFSATDPTDAPRTSGAGVGRAPRWCWVCRKRFTPGQGTQRYCGAKCRRARERWLARTIRAAGRGRAADPVRPGSDCELGQARAYADEVSARVGDMERLGGYLSGRCDPGDWAAPHRTPDPDVQVPNLLRPGLAKLVAGEVRRLDQLRAGLGEWLVMVERAVAERKALQATVERYGPGNSAETTHRARLAELVEQAERWGRELDREL